MWEKLKAYEDLGFEPEEYKRAMSLDIIVRCAAAAFGVPVEQLCEVVALGKAGRLMVLPCKVGDKLYRVFDGNISEHEVQNLKYFARQRRLSIDMTPFFPDAGRFIGKTVFFTREKAEKALEAMKNG